MWESVGVSGFLLYACMTDPTLRLPDVPDILHHVFLYLDPIHYFGEGVHQSRRSLAMAARTCRGFSSPALDILWKRLPDDQPLADLLCTLGIAARENERDDTALPDEEKPNRFDLPRRDGPGRHKVDWYPHRWDLWKLRRGYDIKHFLQDAGDPRQHPSWPRFLEYATRVRAIRLFPFDGPSWCSLWEELLLRIGGAAILPRLAAVAFYEVYSRRASCPGTLALVSPAVRKLDFSIKDLSTWRSHEKNMDTLFSQCFDAAPAIEQLRLEVRPASLGVSLFQAHCSRVRHLEVYPQLNLDDLSVLMQLPALQYLVISLVSKKVLPTASPMLTLESVTTLVIGGIWTELSRALGVMHLPSMHSLVVEGWHYGDPAAELAAGATECFRTIPHHTSLTSLSISTTHGRLPENSGSLTGFSEVRDAFEMSLLDIARPLLTLSALRDVSLHFPDYFTLACTSSDLRSVAEAWPALETLHLRVSEYREEANFRPYVQPRRRRSRSRDGSDPESDSDSGGFESKLPREYPHGGPLAAIAHFARNCPRLSLLHLSAMEMDEDALAATAEVLGPCPEPHGLRTLVVSQVLLPPGRRDMFEQISELVRAVFPGVKCVFRVPWISHGAENDLGDRRRDNWIYADGCTPRCPVCEREPKLPF